MSKRLSLTVATILTVVLMAGPAYPQQNQLLQIQKDLVELKITVDGLLRTMDSKNQNLQILLERVVDKVNLMGGEIQNGVQNSVQTAVQKGVQDNNQTMQANTERLTRLVDEIKAQNDKNTVALNGSLTALNTNLERLAENLSSRIDKANANTDKIGVQLTASTAQVTEKADKNEKLIAAMGDKFTKDINGLQLQLGAISDQISKLANAVQTTSNPLPTPEQIYRECYGYFSAGLLADAEDCYKEILSKFPDHSLAAKAELGKGEVLFSQQKWDEAIPIFETVFTKYKDPVSKKTALYKRGLCEENLKQTEKAIETFTEVIKQYPNTSEAINAAERINKLVKPPPQPTPTPARGGTTPAAPPRAGG